MQYQKAPEPKITLLDRFAIAFASSVLAFITGLIVWLVLAGSNLAIVTVVVLPFKWVIGFTLVMALIGFFMLENFLINIYARLWSGVCYVLGVDPKKL